MKFLIAGDFCIRNYQEDMISDDFIEKVSREGRQLVLKHDLSMYGNETVFSYNGNPIEKSGPCLLSPHKSLEIIKKIGFSIAACANNHIGDYGETGVLETMDFLNENGLLVVGAGKNSKEAEKPLFTDKCGIKLAVINCAEHEFGFAEKNKAGYATLDFYETGHIVKEASEKADKVIVLIHGGNEHNPIPRPGMIKFCHHMAECGADAVIVAHSHCPQGMEMYRDVPVFYGLGNFYFQTPGKQKMWQYGYTVSLNIEKEKAVNAEIIPHRQTEEGFFLLKGGEKEYFMNYFECLCSIIKDEELFEKLTDAWGLEYDRVSSAWFDESTAVLTNKGYQKFIRNSYTCESHTELMARYMKNFCEENFGAKTEKYIDIIHKLQNYEIL